MAYSVTQQTHWNYLIESLSSFGYFESHIPRLYERLWTKKFTSVPHPVRHVLYLDKHSLILQKLSLTSDYKETEFVAWVNYVVQLRTERAGESELFPHIVDAKDYINPSRLM
jgi:hypothetical protein